MKLSKEDADLFFKLMWGLQFYVNQCLGILRDVKSVEEYARLSSTAKVRVRDALWENPGLIDDYVRENPHGLSAEEKEIVQKWKRFVSGSFYLYRLLKKHAIFIGEGKVCGVLALYDDWEKLLGGQPLPVMVEAVLLPFKGKIVYDGLLRGYNIYFGKGIRSSLHEEYMTAKQNDRIITTLEPELEPVEHKKPKKPRKDWGPMVDELVQQMERMRGGPPVQSAAFSLLRASAKLAQAAVREPHDIDELWELEQRVRRALTRLQTTLYRAE